MALFMNIKFYTIIALVLFSAACSKGDKHHHKHKKQEPIAASSTVNSDTNINNTFTTTCHTANDAEIVALFDRWNRSLITGNADAVVANYAPNAILLPMTSNQILRNNEEKKEYFQDFLTNHPSSEVKERAIQIGCNSAIDTGIYVLHYQKTGQKLIGRYNLTYQWDGNKWLISNHHVSIIPEQTNAIMHSNANADNYPIPPENMPATIVTH